VSIATAAGRLRRLSGVDPVLAAAVLALAALGAVLVWSATRPRLLAEGLDPQALVKRHLLNLAIGLVCCVVVAAVDYRRLRAAAPAAYLAACAGLLAVLLIGSRVNGARSWIVVGGGFQLQPAEFAKLGLILGLAAVLGERRGRPRLSVVLAVAGVPMALVMLQPDFGSTVILGAAFFGVLAVSGVPARWLGGLVVAGVLGAVLAVHFGALQGYQADRFRAFAHPSADAQGAGYNTRQARIAIGTGGLTGTGLFHGTQTNGQFVPEQQTDFVFSVAGEELGLLGGGALIALVGVILWRGLAIAARAPDLFGSLVATGVVAWLALQSFVNIGMTLGIMPVTGLPLPFVSYGGSAMFVNLMAVGLLQNINRQSGPGARR